jgi:NAD-dependent dihydropyrimidine dehydrogenase PreA subunit
MTYIIAEPCIDIQDRSCVDVCPVDCIHEFERILIIDPEEVHRLHDHRSPVKSFRRPR